MLTKTIVQHEDVFQEDYLRFVARHCKAKALLLPRLEQVQGELATSVNHGRWIVDCPDCNGAQIASRMGLFFCVDCGNVANRGCWYAVRFPTEQTVIDAVLLTRPPKNRNWQPGETLEQLRAENSLRGLP